MPVDFTALRDDRVNDLGVLSGVAGRKDRAARADGPGGVIEIDERGGEHVHVGVPQAGDRADIPPVSVKAVWPELFAVIQHRGDDVLAEVLVRVRVVLVRDQIGTQLLPVEDVDAHGCQIALRVFRFLFKLIDIAVFTHVHHAHAGRLFHRDLLDRNGEGGVVGEVFAQHVGVIHLIDMVTGEDQNVFGVVVLDEGDVLIDGVGRSGKPRALLILLLVRRKDKDAAVGNVEVPGLAGADVAVQLKRPILGQDTDGVDAGICAVGKRKVDDAILSAKGNAGLCHILCQSIKTRTLPAGEKHRNTALLHLQPPFLVCFRY